MNHLRHFPLRLLTLGITLFGLLSLALLFSPAACAAPAYQIIGNTSGQPLPPVPHAICASSATPVPAGWVITKQTLSFTDPSCKSTPISGWLYTIVPITKQTHTPLSVCGSSPVPAGWVIIAESTPLQQPDADLACPLDATHINSNPFITSPTSKTIAPATGASLTVCADSPPSHRLFLRRHHLLRRLRSLPQRRSLPPLQYPVTTTQEQARKKHTAHQGHTTGTPP